MVWDFVKDLTQINLLTPEELKKSLLKIIVLGFSAGEI